MIRCIKDLKVVLNTDECPTIHLANNDPAIKFEAWPSA